ncbi:MAG: ABC transporter ATP-binding protein [Cyanobacteria bacterium SZAS-4]|nr:ABC transporter ATP-binding protein [Cyanobacteria bacterium SZAS-4]
MIDSQTLNSDKKSATTSAVEVLKVSKRFGTNLAVNNINLVVEPGEFFSFLGPSGCGKTTLLRMIAGFEHPTEGAIAIDGANMVAVPPHKRPVNMVFQNYALFPHLTLGDNVAFGLKSKAKFSKTEIADRVKEALELVRLGQFIDRLPSQISGGQQQRVALARAVVNNPSVLLLDEPLSALDPQIREEMQFELARLQKRLGMTFIMVTHDQNEALALSSRIAVFCQGNLEQVAKPEVIYKSPTTLFVAKFIGQTNVLEGEIAGYDEQYYKLTVDGGLELLATIDGDRLQKGTRIAALIKPSAAHFVRESYVAARGERVFDAQILNKSYQGTSTEFLVSIQGRELRMSSINATSQMWTEERARVLIPAESCNVLPL